MNSTIKIGNYVEQLTSSKESRLGLGVFLGMISFHIGALLIFKVGVSQVAVAVFLLSYFAKGLGITMGFHRYFAHRSFKTSRLFQFFLALLGSGAVQGGVMWWASHHRGHHKHSDQEEDIHSPIVHSVFHSHLGWMWTKECFAKAKYRLNDFAVFPEIKFLNKYYVLVLGVQAAFFYGIGELLVRVAPGLNTNGSQLLVWGFFAATVWTWHITFSINSVCHIFGKPRYKSNDESKNNWPMAILAFGEGWHNNHHKYGWSARNGFRWYELDVTYYILKALSALGIVWDLKVPTEEQLNADLL